MLKLPIDGFRSHGIASQYRDSLYEMVSNSSQIIIHVNLKEKEEEEEPSTTYNLLI